MKMLPEFLKKNYPLEKNLFLVLKFVLYAFGFYPETKRTIWVHLWAGFNFVLFAYSLCTEFYYGMLYIPIDKMMALDVMFPVGVSTMGLLKLICIWWYRIEFAELIHRVRVLTAADCTPSQIRIKRVYFTMVTRLTALVLLFVMITGVAFILRPLVVNIVRLIMGEEWIYDLPFKMWVPKVALSMPMYPITYILVSWRCLIASAGIVAAVSIFFGFCAYITALLKSLQEDIKVVLGEEKAMAVPNSIESKEANERCRNLLAGIIDRYNEIFDLTEKFSKAAVAITLIHFLSSSLIIGMCIIVVILFSGNQVYVVYTCSAITELFLFCYGGSSIIEASHEVGDTVYGSQWYTRNVPVQKMALLFIKRCQQPFVVKIPFFVPSVPVFASIIRFTGSLITLVQSIL